MFTTLEVACAALCSAGVGAFFCPVLCTQGCSALSAVGGAVLLGAVAAAALPINKAFSSSVWLGCSLRIRSCCLYCARK